MLWISSAREVGDGVEVKVGVPVLHESFIGCAPRRKVVVVGGVSEDASVLRSQRGASGGASSQCADEVACSGYSVILRRCGCAIWNSRVQVMMQRNRAV